MPGLKLITSTMLFMSTMAVAACPEFPTSPQSHLRVGLLGTAPRTLDPMAEPNEAERIIISNIHASLQEIVENPDGGWRWKNAVASFVRKALRQNVEVMTIRLKPDPTYPDGRSVEARDAQKSLRWAMDMDGEFEGLEIEILNDTTIELSSDPEHGIPKDIANRLFYAPMGFVLPFDYERPTRSGWPNYRPPSLERQIAAGLGRYEITNMTDKSVTLTCRWSDVPTFTSATFYMFADIVSLWNALEDWEIDLMLPLDASHLSSEMKYQMAVDPTLTSSVHSIARQYVLQPRTGEGPPTRNAEATNLAVQAIARGLVFEEEDARFFESAEGPLPAVLLSNQSLEASLPNTTAAAAAQNAWDELNSFFPVEIEFVARSSDGVGRIVAEAMVRQLREADISANVLVVDIDQFRGILDNREQTTSADTLRYLVGFVETSSTSIRPILEGYKSLAGTESGESGTLGDDAAMLLSTEGLEFEAGSFNPEMFWFGARELPFGSAIPLVDVNVVVARNNSVFVASPIRSFVDTLVVAVTPDGQLGPLHLFRSPE